MRASEKIKDFIKEQEGCKLTAYKPLETDVWTVGYGNTYIDGEPVEQGFKISQQKADELFNVTIDKLASQLSVNPRIPANVTGNQFDAVVSLVYNIGYTAFKGSPTGKLFYAGLNISDKFPLWSRSGGKVILGLINRRKRERAIYDSGDYST